jgi:sugar transferase (PEP-CTERM/EpsH1 system associated)
MARNTPPLIAHVIHGFTTGGLQQGLLNLINHLPAERFRHAVVCIHEFTDFSLGIQQPDVPVLALHHNWLGRNAYWHLYRTLRALQPDIVHTRNIGTLEGQICAAAAGVRARIHGEHGRDSYDLDGSNRRHRLVRRCMAPLVTHFTSVSADLANWLVGSIGIPARRVTCIYNGVDALRFRPRVGARTQLGPEGFVDADSLVIGTIGRMAEVKDQTTLARAFVELLNRFPAERRRLRLTLVGEGPLRAEAMDVLKLAGIDNLAWIPGERSDVPELLRGMDIFVLPSLAEGLSNGILEAMATGLPVVATRVGGNGEMVDDGHTGFLVDAANPGAMASALGRYISNPSLLRSHGEKARQRAEADFSIGAMVAGYAAVYDLVLASQAIRPAEARRQSGIA